MAVLVNDVPQGRSRNLPNLVTVERKLLTLFVERFEVSRLRLKTLKDLNARQ